MSVFAIGLAGDESAGMRSVGAHEAQTHLPRLLGELDRGMTQAVVNLA